jgi:hypothetical protein
MKTSLNTLAIAVALLARLASTQALAAEPLSNSSIFNAITMASGPYDPADTNVTHLNYIVRIRRGPPSGGA